MSRPRKNTKRIDPRYFMDEKILQEGADSAKRVEWGTPEAKEEVATLLETDVDQIIKWDPKEIGTPSLPLKPAWVVPAYKMAAPNGFALLW